uniref:Uncharacterized protein n=1 Tax=Rhipicephalus zambeziensis TaxID=60191 RepID=A0A224YRF6_9ACAR
METIAMGLRTPMDSRRWTCPLQPKNSSHQPSHFPKDDLTAYQQPTCQTTYKEIQLLYLYWPKLSKLADKAEEIWIDRLQTMSYSNKVVVQSIDLVAFSAKHKFCDHHHQG